MDLTMLLFLPVQPLRGPAGPRPRGPEDEPVGEDEDDALAEPSEEPPKTPDANDANPIDPRIMRILREED